MFERESYKPNSEEIKKTESMMTNEERELSIEREREQKQFEFFTRQAIDRFKDMKDVRWGLPKELDDYAKEIDCPLAGWGSSFTFSATKIIAGYLLNAKKGMYKSLRPSPELQNPYVLEVGGFDGEDLKWPSAAVFMGGFNYTGIDNDPFLTQEADERFVTDRGTRREGKLYEKLAMDVMDVDKKLAGRKYELIFGMAFLGHPTRSSAKARGLSGSEYESSIFTKLRSVLREGGIMFFVNRENPALSADDISKLGFEVVEKEFAGGYQLLILRKIPEAEKKT